MKNRLNRRKFLNMVSCGSGLLSAGAMKAQAEESSKKENATSIALAIHTGMFRRYRGAQMFEQIRKAGYRHVELSGGQIRAAANSDQSANRLKQQLDDAELTPAAAFVVHRLASSDDVERRKSITQWRRSIDGIRELDIKLVGTELTGDIRKAGEGETAFRKSMDELLPHIEEAQFHLSVEPHPGDFFETALPTIEVLKSYQSKHLGYLHCTPHTFYFGESISNVIKEAGELLTHVHISDTFRTNRIMDRFGTGVGLHLHLQAGLGEVDFEETFTALSQINFRGFASVQLLSHVDAPDEAAKATRIYLEKLLGNRLAA